MTERKPPYEPGKPIVDHWPAKHRIRPIRGHGGELLGFGTTNPGGKVIMQRFPDMMGALAKLNETCDFIYGPMRTYPEALK